MEKSVQQGKISARQVAISAALGVGITALSLLVAAILLNAGKIPHDHDGTAVSVALLLGAIATGILATRKSATPKIVCALISGAILFAFTIVAGVGFLGAGFLSMRTVLNLVTILIGVVCGGIVTSAGGGRHRRRR